MPFCIVVIYSLRIKEAIILRIKWEVKARMLVKGNFKKTMANIQLAQRWNLV
jgi:hypothetical protein